MVPRILCQRSPSFVQGTSFSPLMRCDSPDHILCGVPYMALKCSVALLLCAYAGSCQRGYRPIIPCRPSSCIGLGPPSFYPDSWANYALVVGPPRNKLGSARWGSVNIPSTKFKTLEQWPLHDWWIFEETRDTSPNIAYQMLLTGI